MHGVQCSSKMRLAGSRSSDPKQAAPYQSQSWRSALPVAREVGQKRVSGELAPQKSLHLCYVDEQVDELGSISRLGFTICLTGGASTSWCASAEESLISVPMSRSWHKGGELLKSLEEARCKCGVEDRPGVDRSKRHSQTGSPHKSAKE
jgi:hypothetical protein